MITTTAAYPAAPLDLPPLGQTGLTDASMNNNNNNNNRSSRRYSRPRLGGWDGPGTLTFSFIQVSFSRSFIQISSILLTCLLDEKSI